MTEPAMRRRWEHQSNGRYYEARIMRNLFGDWELQRVWGQKGSRLGQIRYEQHTSLQACLSAMESTHKRRLARGYQPLGMLRTQGA